MRHSVLARVLVVLATLVGAASNAAAASCFDVGLRFNMRAPSALLLNAAAVELAEVWSSYGVRIATAADSWCGVADGSFDVSVERGQSSHYVRAGGLVLGSTHLQLAAIDHAQVHIDYDAIERTLTWISNRRLLAIIGRPDSGAAEVGRALGRVLAHEIGHVLLAAPAHQPTGLMRASFPPEELILADRSAFTLSAREIQRLHNREDALQRSLDPFAR